MVRVLILSTAPLPGLSEGYGFLEFRSHEAAETILRTYNGHPIPGTEQVFRLNWAAFGVGKNATEADHSIFVGDLAPDVTDIILQEYFRQFYPSVRSAKVRWDGCDAWLSSWRRNHELQLDGTHGWLSVLHSPPSHFMFSSFT